MQILNAPKTVMTQTLYHIMTQTDKVNDLIKCVFFWRRVLFQSFTLDTPVML